MQKSGTPIGCEGSGHVHFIEALLVAIHKLPGDLVWFEACRRSGKSVPRLLCLWNRKL